MYTKKYISTPYPLMALLAIAVLASCGRIDDPIITEEPVVEEIQEEIQETQEEKIELIERRDVPLTKAQETMLAGNNEFAFSLFRECYSASESKSEDCFISPLSVTSVLSLLSNGAKGQTNSNITSVLGFGSVGSEEANDFYGVVKEIGSLDPSSKFSLANSILLDRPYSLAPDFKEVSDNVYDALCENLDFTDQEGCSQHLNSWVAKQTNNLIESVPVQFSGNVSVITNTVYFKGLWKDKFKESSTIEEDFHGADVKKVPMMSRVGACRFCSKDDYSAVVLPYGNEAFQMTVILPAEGTSLNQFVKGMDSEKWSGLESSMRDVNVSVKLPRFTTEWSSSIVPELQALGMDVALARSADFSGMIQGSADIFLSDVYHKSKIIVNESGTEAAAVTSGIATSAGPGAKIPELHADRPFMYVISEISTGAIMFLGSYSGR